MSFAFLCFFFLKRESHYQCHWQTFWTCRFHHLRLWALRWLFSCIYLYVNCSNFNFLSSSLQDTEIKTVYSPRGATLHPVISVHSQIIVEHTQICDFACVHLLGSLWWLYVSDYSFGDEQRLVLLTLNVLLRKLCELSFFFGVTTSARAITLLLQGKGITCSLWKKE